MRRDGRETVFEIALGHAADLEQQQERRRRSKNGALSTTFEHLELFAPVCDLAHEVIGGGVHCLDGEPNLLSELQ